MKKKPSTHLKPYPSSKPSHSQIAYNLLVESRELVGQAQALYYEGTFQQRKSKIDSAIAKLRKAKEIFSKLQKTKKHK